jgi:hypothetical protein
MFYFLQVERARSADLERKNQKLQAELEQTQEHSSISLPSFRPDNGRRQSIVPSALAPVHIQVFAHIVCRRAIILRLLPLGSGTWA